MTYQYLTYRYCTGQIVLEGDRIRTGNRNKKGVPIEGVIQLILQPGSEDAEAYQAPDGGVLIEENWNGIPSLLVIEPEKVPCGWEDVEFIERASRNTA
jgi:hypothetical protein